jgi:hypothetical protein
MTIFEGIISTKQPKSLSVKQYGISLAPRYVYKPEPHPMFKIDLVPVNKLDLQVKNQLIYNNRLAEIKQQWETSNFQRSSNPVPNTINNFPKYEMTDTVMDSPSEFSQEPPAANVNILPQKRPALFSPEPKTKVKAMEPQVEPEEPPAANVNMLSQKRPALFSPEASKKTKVKALEQQVEPEETPEKLQRILKRKGDLKPDNRYVKHKGRTYLKVPKASKKLKLSNNNTPVFSENPLPVFSENPLPVLF